MTANTDCLPCLAGYLCTVEGVGDLNAFACPAGSYCTLNALDPTARPEGTDGDVIGGASLADCLPCPGGYYCEEGQETPMLCQSGIECPIGSKEQLPCPPGKYCPPGTAAGITCPRAFYCPGGTEEYYKCVNGTYCPAGSASETLCPPGTFGNGNPDNYNIPVSCAECDAATYSTLDRPGECLPCTAGYVCLGRTTTPFPEDKILEKGYKCPQGYYCPTGSMDPLPCPAGTYNHEQGGKDINSCSQCPVG